eukprot:gene668-biopygen552
METLKKLRRLAKPNDWCFSFDLQDGFLALGIHPDFQKFMQFDIQGELKPFGWSDAPRVFCKFRNEEKGQWDPVQVIEHLGLEVDLKVGQSWFRELEALATEVVIVPRHKDLFTLSRLGGSELLGPSKWDAVMFFIQASPLAVYWKDDDKFYPGVVKNFNEDGAALVVYDDGDEETLNLSEEKFNILLSEGVYEQNMERGGDYEENKRGDFTDLAILMQRRSLLDSTLSNYGPKTEIFVQFCVLDVVVLCRLHCVRAAEVHAEELGALL